MLGLILGACVFVGVLAFIHYELSWPWLLLVFLIAVVINIGRHINREKKLEHLE